MAFNQSISAPYAGASTGYPVHVEFPILENHNKFYAIPIVGYVVRWVMLIPYIIVLAVLGLVVYVCQLVVWFPVMTTGQYPAWAFRLNTGLIRYVKRFSSFQYGLTDRYPSFSLEDHPGDGDAMVVFEPQQSYSKFYAIPIVGIVVKEIMLIPHLVILYILDLRGGGRAVGDLDPSAVRRPIPAVGLPTGGRLYSLERSRVGLRPRAHRPVSSIQPLRIAVHQALVGNPRRPPARNLVRAASVFFGAGTGDGGAGPRIFRADAPLHGGASKPTSRASGRNPEE